MLSSTLKWNTTTISKSDIHLPTVLRAGQAFRWRKLNNVWSCVLNDKLVLLSEDGEEDSANDKLKYTTLSLANGKLIENSGESSWNFIEAYLNLNHDLNSHHLHWSKVDPHFPQFRYPTPETDLEREVKKEDIGNKIKHEAIDTLITPPPSLDISPGVRILLQEPWEVLISFIISSNNNIKRISQLCETLCIAYGRPFGNIDGVEYYSFPKPNELFKLDEKSLGIKDIEISSDSITTLESQLRALGFGYRAKYITKTAQKMLSNHENWLKLKQCEWEDDEECVTFLRQFDGVGPKVADCVALMGCQRHDLVPIDTHVWKMVQTIYKKEFIKWVSNMKEEDEEDKHIKTALKKSLSNKAVDVKLYPFIKRFFREFWELKAGWAQAVVFAGEIRLENGINCLEDMEKLNLKVNNIFVDRKEAPQEPLRKRQRKLQS